MGKSNQWPQPQLSFIFENRKGQAYTNSWTINDREGPENVCEELSAIMKSCKYRASFWDSLLVNLKIFFSGGYSPPGEKNNRITFHLTGMLEDGGDFAVTYYGATAIFMADSTVVAKAADQEIGDKLLAYIQKFGQES